MYLLITNMLKSVLENNKVRSNVVHEENQYLNLIEDILNHGDEITGRNGKTKLVFGSVMHFSLRDNVIPILTTKKVAWKTCLKELLWFIKGDTSNKKLNDQNVHIWDKNASKDFMESRQLNYSQEGDLGPIYGFQWRHFNAKYENCESDYQGKGVDQLKEIINMLKDEKEKFSRRIILTAWNPQQLNEMALPPCHILAQFHVNSENELSTILYQRSGDIGLGVPFNIASYSFLTHILAKHCDLKVGEFIHYLGDTHIYDDHYENLKKQIQNIPKKFPKININCKKSNINDYTLEDFEIIDYQHHEKIKMEMRK